LRSAEAPCGLGDGEADLLGDVTGVATPCPQVEHPGALVVSCLVFQVVHDVAPPERFRATSLAQQCTGMPSMCTLTQNS
jgi:hypothetical protein